MVFLLKEMSDPAICPIGKELLILNNDSCLIQSGEVCAMWTKPQPVLSL